MPSGLAEQGRHSPRRVASSLMWGTQTKRNPAGQKGLCGHMLPIEKSKQCNFGVALLCCSHGEGGSKGFRIPTHSYVHRYCAGNPVTSEDGMSHQQTNLTLNQTRNSQKNSKISN